MTQFEGFEVLEEAALTMMGCPDEGAFITFCRAQLTPLAVALPSATDWNTLTTAGIFYSSTGDNLNTPSALNGFYLQVYSLGTGRNRPLANAK
jgi:hypothetical protein